MGAGKIKFGMTPEQVRLLLGGVFDSFKRTEESVFPCDYSRMGLIEWTDYNDRFTYTWNL